jgi:hypothetical protein
MILSVKNIAGRSFFLGRRAGKAGECKSTGRQFRRSQKPISIYLAISGVGKIILADFDSVDPSNLNRQILHYEKDIEGLRSSLQRKGFFL